MIKVKKRKILLLPGDGIGPEVIGEVKKIISWFNDKNRKVVKIRTGKAWGLILAYNPETKFHELYGLGGGDNNRMGEESEVKKIYGDNFKLIQTFSNIQKDIVDFAGSMQACFVIT